MHPEDVVIIAHFLRHKPDAVETIRRWVEEAARPFRIVLAEEWEDIKQETLLKVTRALQQKNFRGDSRLRTFTWRVTSCTCIDARRRKRPWIDLDSSSESLVAPGASPLEKLLDDESEQLRLRILEDMPKGCQTLWRMILDGLSDEAIGNRLSLTANAVRQRVFRCREQAVAILNRRLKRSR